MIRSIASPLLWVGGRSVIAGRGTKVLNEKNEAISFDDLRQGQFVSVEGDPEKRTGRLRARTIQLTVRSLVVVEPKSARETAAPINMLLRRPPPQKVTVRLHGILVPIPHDDPADLQLLLETLYILEGWRGINHFRQEISLILFSLRFPKSADLDEYLDFGLRPSLIAPAAGTSREDLLADLQQGFTVADIPYLEELQRTFAEAIESFTARVNTILLAVDEQARQLATDRLRRSRAQALKEGQRYFNFTTESSVRAAFASSTSFPVHANREDVKELRRRLTRLRPAAERAHAKEKELRDAESKEKTTKEAVERARRNNLRLSADPLSQIREKVAVLRRPFEELAMEQVKDAVEFPVLHRFSVKVLLRATENDHDDTVLGDLVYGRLRRTYLAAGKILGKLNDKPAGDASPPSVDELEKKKEGSVWWYPKMIDEALSALGADPDTLEFAVAKSILAELALRRGGEMAEGVTESLISMGLTAACPPAGFALDLALAGRDIWRATVEYGQRSDEYECALNPNDILGAEPSLLPVGFAIAGAIITLVARPAVHPP
jgi:hypothetical protein